MSMDSVNIEFDQFMHILSKRSTAISFGELLKRADAKNIQFVKDKKSDLDALRNKPRSSKV